MAEGRVITQEDIVVANNWVGIELVFSYLQCIETNKTLYFDCSKPN